MSHKYKRIFVIVADSVGIGYEPDADKFFNDGHNDVGSNTIVHISEKMPNGLNVPTMNSWGLHDLDNNIVGTSKVSHPHAYVARSREASNGKDTMTGHWEMMVSQKNSLMNSKPRPVTNVLVTMLLVVQKSLLN